MDVATLLASGATANGSPLQPGDVAVLVRTNDQGTVRDALAAAGCRPCSPARRASSARRSPPREWLTLLEALEQPRPIRIRGRGTDLLRRLTVADLAGRRGRAARGAGRRLRRWATVLADAGRRAAGGGHRPEPAWPAARPPDGERGLTDLRHVGQALHAATVEAHLGPAALVEWLRHRIDEAATDVGLERSRRLESDAAAVQIVTIHRSKGLEFPVVYLPFGWDRFVPRARAPCCTTTPAGACSTSAATGPGYGRTRGHEAEEAGEDLRLLYVALTRAQSDRRLVGAGHHHAASPLHRLLLGADARGWRRRPPTVSGTERPAALATCGRWAGAGRRARPVGRSARPGRPPPPAPPRRPLSGRLRPRARPAWRRTSYTALTAGPRSPPGSPAWGGRREGSRRRGSRDPDGGARPGRPAAPGGRGPTCRRRWPTSRSGPGSARSCTPFSRLPTSPRPTCPAELAARVHAELDRQPAPTSTRTRWPPHWCRSPAPRSVRSPAGDGWPTSRRADRLAELDFELPLAVATRATPAVRRCLGDSGPAVRRPPARRRPAGRLPRALAAPGWPRSPARLPHRQHRRRLRLRPARRRARYASSTTRRTGSARSAGGPSPDRRHYTPAGWPRP